MTWLQIDDNFEDHAKVELISDAAHRLWMRAACFCKKPENAHTPLANGFVPRALLPKIAKYSATPAKLEKLADELVNARGGGMFEAGLWETADDGWRFHDWDFWQARVRASSPSSSPPESGTRSRSEIARAAGKRSAEARAARFGSAQPKPPESPNVPNVAERPFEPTFEHAPEHAFEGRSEHAFEHTPEHPRTSGSDPKSGSLERSSKDLTGFPRARGERPNVRSGLLPEKIAPNEWAPPNEFRDYALEQGLTEQQYADVVADFREKITRTAALPWLASQLCRFIETRAERARRKARGELGLVSGDAPRQAAPPAVEGEVVALVPGEPPSLPEPLKWKSWECDPGSRLFSRGKDSEGGIWTLDAERRLRRKAPPPRLVEAPEAVEVGKSKGNGKPARTKPPEAPAARSGGAGS